MTIYRYAERVADMQDACQRLLSCNHELHIARYLASGVQLKKGPSQEYRDAYVVTCENSVKSAMKLLQRIVDMELKYGR